MIDEPPYELFGLTVFSELPLPDLVKAERQGAQVDVTYGSVPPQHSRVSIGPGGALLLDIPDVARFEISGGSRILVDPAPGAQEREIRMFLLGSAFGVLLHQRGLLPLHANTIEIDGHAISFLGRSGAGKSTLAHWFQQRGFAVLADDVSAISLENGAVVMPGVPRLRLWQDALDAAGLGQETFPRSYAGHEKFDVPASPKPRKPLSLAACYLLAEVAEGEPPAITPQTMMQAVDTLMANTFRGRMVPVLGLTEEHLRLCLRLAEHVPVLRASRLWGRNCFEKQALMLEKHAIDLIHARNAGTEKRIPSVEVGL